MHPCVKVKIPDCNRQRIGNPLPPSHEANLVINEDNDRVLGRGTDLPIAAQPSVKELFANAFIRLPCPKKTTGIRSVIEP
jgi:hypothetical protein